MNLNDLKDSILLICLIVIIAACAVIALNGFNSSLPSSTICGSSAYPYINQSNVNINDYGNVCMNQTTGALTLYAGSTSYAYNISAKQGIPGIATSTSFMSTIGTVAAVAVLIGIVVMAFRF